MMDMRRMDDDDDDSASTSTREIHTHTYTQHTPIECAFDSHYYSYNYSDSYLLTTATGNTSSNQIECAVLAD